MKSKYSFIVGERFVNVINLSTGENTVVMIDNPRFNDALADVKSGNLEGFEHRYTVKGAVNKFVSATASGETGLFKIFLENSRVYYTYKGGQKTELDNAIVNRIVDQAAAGFDVKPLCNFMANLLENPNPTSINELYLFLDACKLPITEDGHFIAYKIVRNDFMDIYTGTMRNQIGDIPEMPRFEVDTNRDNTCSKGLHFCSKDYLNAYGSGSRDSDRAMLVKINPADVVSIPSDYNNAKGRAWRYEVVGEVPAGWRDTLPKVDYTNAPIVSSTGSDLDDQVPFDPPHEYVRFVFNTKTRRWHDSSKYNAMVSRMTVANSLGCTVQDVENEELQYN